MPTKRQPGAFERDMNYIGDRITTDAADGWPVEAGRYRLVVAHACNWPNRSWITHRLLGLESAISVGTAGPLHDASSWNFHLDPDGKSALADDHAAIGSIDSSWYGGSSRAEAASRPVRPERYTAGNSL